MSRRALSVSEFAEYARAQIRTADAVLARHRPGNCTICECGRPLPCSQAEAVLARKDHYLAQLGLAETTILFPVVTSSSAPPQASGQRGLLSWLARRNR